MRKRWRKEMKNQKIIIIAGFIVMYLLVMTIATYFLKVKSERQMQNQIYMEFSEWISEVDNEPWKSYGENEAEQNCFADYLAWCISKNVNYDLSSVVVYTNYGKKIAQSSVVLKLNYIPQYAVGELETYEGRDTFYFDLADYLTEEEIKEVINYYEEHYERKNRYSIQGYISEETGKLLQLKIYSLTDEQYAKEEVWDWRNSEAADVENVLITPRSNVSFELAVPTTLEMYDEWKENEFLQIYPEQIDALSGYETVEPLGNVDYFSIIASSVKGNVGTGVKRIMDKETGKENDYIMVGRYIPHVWNDILLNIIWIYIIGFLVLSYGLWKICKMLDRTKMQSENLEETRKDFTNAIAHELKTPLGIIRGFSENLKENTNTEKNGYYIEQIIGQTEVMDELVQEMIYVSKLDSNKLVLKNEEISIKTMIEQQLLRLETLVQEKNLTILYEENGGFELNGDPYYMEKAVWNLLSNAIAYNRQDGFIKIRIDAKKWSIENSGEHISEKDLPHVCEMFYTGDKSRNSKIKHTGLGLYLSKKIFGMHELTLKVENGKDGVIVTVEK